MKNQIRAELDQARRALNGEFLKRAANPDQEENALFIKRALSLLESSQHKKTRAPLERAVLTVYRRVYAQVLVELDGKYDLESFARLAQEKIAEAITDEYVVQIAKQIAHDLVQLSAASGLASDT